MTLEEGREVLIQFLALLLSEFYMPGRLNDEGIVHMLEFMLSVSKPTDPVDHFQSKWPDLIPWDNLRADSERLKLERET